MSFFNRNSEPVNSYKCANYGLCVPTTDYVCTTTGHRTQPHMHMCINLRRMCKPPNATVNNWKVVVLTNGLELWFLEDWDYQART